jgi:molecular chaperone GrpE
MTEDKKEENNKKENNKTEEDKSENKKAENGESIEVLRESLLRLAAEFDNYKKRTYKEIEISEQRGKMNLARKLLSILDEFELAAKNMDMSTEEGKGIAIVLSNFIDILKKEGLSEMESTGIFDPYKHEVLMTKESNEKEGTIIATLRKGYLWKDMMLRPASVVVAKAPVHNHKGERESKEHENEIDKK